jgi:anthranilate synthase component 1
VTSNNTKEAFMKKVERAKEYIRRGDTYQIQVSQRFERRTDAHPFEVYRALRRVNPSPYMYYLELGDMHVVGASPEMLIRVEDGVIETHPIAGTRRRGRDAEDEQHMADELQSSEKERAEHIMLVDLARNDLGRVCQAGSVQVTSLMAIERYSHVMHMVSHVVGKLRRDVTTYDALRAYFPHGTVTGAPKIRTMEIIAELEGERRGGYGGCVGYFDMSGNCDTALSIRTIWMKPGVAYMQAAGGVVFDSTPEEEYMESGNKARAMMRAIELAEERQDETSDGSPAAMM